MADTVFDVNSPAATPSAGQAGFYPDSVSKKWTGINDAGRYDTLGDLENSSTANQTGFAADTYLAGSSIAVPGHKVQVGTRYHLILDMVKNAAGTATPIFIVRIGTAGTVADAARLTFTFAAGTAATDTGVIELWAHFRTVGATATMAGVAKLDHHLAATGLTTSGAAGTGIILATAASFDASLAGLIIGTSFNGGTSFAGTNTVVQSRLFNC